MKTLKTYVITRMESCQISCVMIPHSVRVRDGKRMKWVRSNKRSIQIIWKGRRLQLLGHDWDISRGHMAWDVCCGEIVFLELGFDL